MDYDRYQQLASRTAKQFRDLNENLLYYALGLCGEAAEVGSAVQQELSVQDLSKEIGDTSWYIAHLGSLLEIPMSAIVAVRPSENYDYEVDDDAALGLCVRAGTVGEIIKKIARDGREVDRVLLTAKLGAVFEHLHLIAKLHGIYIGDVLDENIKKLEARYPKNAFDAKDAVARKDGEALRE